MSVENFIAVIDIGSFEKSEVSQSINDKEHEIGTVFLCLTSVYIIFVCYNFRLYLSFSCVDNIQLSWEIFCYYAQNHYCDRGSI